MSGSETGYEELEDQKGCEVGRSSQGEDEKRMERKIGAHNTSEDDSAERTDGTANADDAGDGGGREHIGGRGEEVG